MSRTLTPRQRLQFALETDHGVRTIDAVYAGKRCHAGTYERVVRAAKKLRAPLPPPQPERPALGVCMLDVEARR
jgi:hypothetical protein